MKDNINPDHYKNQTSLECIEAMIIAFGYQKTIDFCLLNAWKYIWRWKNKNGTEDLDKANWYIERGLSLKPDCYEKAIFERMNAYIHLQKDKEENK